MYLRKFTTYNSIKFNVYPQKVGLITTNTVVISSIKEKEYYVLKKGLKRPIEKHTLSDKYTNKIMKELIIYYNVIVKMDFHPYD